MGRFNDILLVGVMAQVFDKCAKILSTTPRDVDSDICGRNFVFLFRMSLSLGYPRR